MKYQILRNDNIQIKHPNPPNLPINLYRIIALKDFHCNDKFVKEGEIGGYLQYESNLSQEDNSWIGENGKVFGDAILEDSYVAGDARVFGKVTLKNTNVKGKAWVYDSATLEGSYISGNASVFGNCHLVSTFVFNAAQVTGFAKVYDSELTGGARISGASVVNNCHLMDQVELKNAVCENCHYSGRVVVLNESRKNETLNHEVELNVVQGDLDKRPENL